MSHSPTGDAVTDRLHYEIRRVGRIILYYIDDGWWSRKAINSVCHAHGEFKKTHSPIISLAIDDLVKLGLLEREPPLGKFRVRRPA